MGLPGGRVCAASGVLPRLDRPLVVIDAGLSGLQRDAAACHEGAHVVLHPRRNRIYMQPGTLLLPGRYETEADVFALAYLLRWDPGLAEQFGWDTGRLARACGLPILTMLGTGLRRASCWASPGTTWTLRTGFSASGKTMCKRGEDPKGRSRNPRAAARCAAACGGR